MWQFLIITLFVFNSGHGRTFLSPKSNTEDVYELTEDKAANSVSFVNPKSVMPILREITYYHVVEKPYDAVIKQNKEVVDTSSEDETERPFTNAHGLEFIDTYAVNETVTKTEENEDEDLIDYLLLEEVDDEKAEGSNVQVDQTTEVLEGDKKMTTLVPEEEEEEKIEILKEAKEVGTEPSTTTGVLPEVEPANDQLINETETSDHEQKASRNERNRLLFGSPEMLKERYMKMKNLIPTIKPKEKVIANVSEKVETVKSRRRRSTIEENIAKIPEAPKLAELNFNILPEYIKRLYSSKNPFIINPTPIKVTTENSESKEVEKYEEIEQKLEDMFTAIKPEAIQEMDINADGIVNMATDEVRTYGMNLTSDRGYIWNNLWSNPGMTYHVGELETVEENRDKEQTAEPQLQHSKPEEQIFKPDEKPDEKPNTEEEKPKPNKEESEDSLDDLNDIYVNVDKQKPKPNEMQPIVEQSTPIEVDHKPENQDETEGVEDKEKDEEKDPESLKELLNNKKFWDWLSDWTSTYMELLIKHIGIIVKEEISKQKESNKSDPIKNKDEQGLNKDDGEIENLQETNKNGDQENENNSTADKEPNTSISSHNPENKDIENEKTIFIDGKKVPLTYTSNFNQTSEHLSKKRHKEDQKEVKNKETKVLAQNIYGNSVGSSKVVNLYFFFTEDKKKIIDELVKPLFNENSNINNVNVTFENRVNVPDEDKKAEEEPKKEYTKKEDSKKEDSKKEDSKKEDSKKEDFKKEDSKKEDSKIDNSQEEDSKKEDSKNGDSKKEDSKKEDSKKEDSKKEDSKKEDSKKEDFKKEYSKKEDSKIDNSQEEDSKKEDSKNGDSKKEDSKKEDSKKEDSKKEDSKKEDSKKEDSKIDNSKEEDFKNEDSKNEDSKKEDSKKEDSKKEDSKKEDSKKEDYKKDDLKKEHSKKEDSEKEDSKKEDSKKEDSKKEDYKKDDLKKEHSKKEDSKKEDSKKEDSKKEDSKKEDYKKDDLKKEHSKKEGSKKEDSKKEISTEAESKKEDIPKTNPETTINLEPTTENPQEDSKEENSKATTVTSVTEASTTTKLNVKDKEEHINNAEKNDREKSSENEKSSSNKDSNKDDQKDTKDSETIDAGNTVPSDVEESKQRGDSDVKESKKYFDQLDIKIESEKRAYQSLFSQSNPKEKTKTKNTKL